MDVVIRSAVAGEAEQILALQRLCYRSEAELYEDWSIPPMTQTLPELLAEYEDHEVLVARLGDEIVGSVRCRQEDGTCHAGRLIVHPRMQRKGIGGRLMLELEGRFAQAERFELFTGHESEGNLRLYRRLGYERVREQRVSPRLWLVYLQKARTRLKGAGMNLEVIGASFGRTGTMSMKAALEELGFGPCYHMRELFRHPEHQEQWRAAMRGDPVDWERVLGDYRATVDWPGCTFYGELLKRNPDAKVILTVRDPQRWYESVRDTIYTTSRAYYSVAFRLAGLVSPKARRLIRANRFVSELVWEGTFDGRFGDRGHAIETFERHNEEVERRVPPGRLLVYEVKQGWGPLCDFLGVEEPDNPFPHLNDGEAYRGWVRRVRLFTTAALAVGVSLAGLAVLRLGRGRRR